MQRGYDMTFRGRHMSMQGMTDEAWSASNGTHRVARGARASRETREFLKAQSPPGKAPEWTLEGREAVLWSEAGARYWAGICDGSKAGEEIVSAWAEPITEPEI